MNRYAVRGVSGLAAGALGVVLGLAGATGSSAAEPPSPDWGAGQARPPLSESQGADAQAPADGPEGAAPSDPAPRTMAAAAAASPDWVLHGSGWGHGLGMSQYGAWEMARDGKSAKAILTHYYSGISYDAVTDNQTIDVNIVNSTTKVTAVSSALGSGGGTYTVVAAGDTRTMTGQAGEAVTFTRSGGNVVASCTACTGATSLAGTTLILRWDTLAQDKTLMKVGGSQYRDGTMRLRPTGASSFNVVNRVRLHDEYLDYLAESPWSWNLEALKAQAAAARGYALAKYNAGLRSGCDCHVYDTTMDQVYGGYSTVTSGGNEPYWQNWKNAVRATGSGTTGYVARSGGKIISALYSSSSGGRTENNEEVWGGTPLSYLRGVGDSYSLRSSNPLRSWRQVASGPSMATKFGLSDVVKLDLSSRTSNGGVRWATATSSSGATSTISGDQFRGVVATGTGRVNSTMIRHLTQRLGGDNRYAVGAAVARTVAAGASSVVVASGENTNLPDASVAGPLAATLNAPLLLTQRDRLPAETVTELSRRGNVLKTAYVIGGTGAVSDAVAAQLRGKGLSVVRLAGVNRYSTSVKVANEIAARRTVSSVVVAGGAGLVDALSASGPASARREPILLVPVNAIPPSTESALEAMAVNYVRIVGGTAVVGQAVEDRLKASYSVRRLGGADRYAVSAAVANYYRGLLPSTSEVIVTNGQDGSLVDSLVAGTRQSLMALVLPTSLPATTQDVLQRTPALETVTAVGGTAVVSNSVLTRASRS